MIGADQVPVGGIPVACPTPLPVFHGYLIGGRVGGSLAAPAAFFRQLVALAPSGGGAAALGSMIEPVGSGPRCDAGPALGLARIAADGTAGVATILSAAAPAVSVALAGDQTGDVGAVWTTDGTPMNFSRTTAHATIETAAGRTVTRTIASAVDGGGFNYGIGSVAVAFGPGGDLLVVYGKLGGVWAVTLGADGTVGRPQRLGAALGLDTAVSVGESAGGGAVAAWTNAPGGMDAVGPTAVYYARRTGAGRPFLRPVRLDAGAADEAEGGVGVAVGADGRAALEWENYAAHGVEVLRAAVGSVTAGLAAPVLLSSGPFTYDPEQIGSPAVGPDGTITLTWVTRRDQVVAALIPPGGGSSPGPATPVSPANDGGNSPVAAFDSTGRPFVVWLRGLDADHTEARVARLP